MRAIRLAQVAIEAEVLRWRCFGSRLAVRALFAVIALFFAAGVMVFAHVAGWIWLTQTEGRTELTAAASLAGVDLVLAALFGCLAARSAPGRGELAALEVRREAIRGMGSAFDTLRMIGVLLRLFNTARGGRRKD